MLYVNSKKKFRGEKRKNLLLCRVLNKHTAILLLGRVPGFRHSTNVLFCRVLCVCCVYSCPVNEQRMYMSCVPYLMCI